MKPISVENSIQRTLDVLKTSLSILSLLNRGKDKAILVGEKMSIAIIITLTIFSTLSGLVTYREVAGYGVKEDNIGSPFLEISISLLAAILFPIFIALLLIYFLLRRVK